jgi:hypothetical protein
MRQVAPPAVDDEQVYDQIAAAKHKVRRASLKAARTVVLGAYDDYAAAAPDVADLPDIAFNQLQKAALIHAYSVETKPFAKLRERLTEPVILVRCPFCSLSEASTLDHYLPKELHPQFAVYSRNLVPCCSQCNTRKSELVLDDAKNVRLFLHPYFDAVPPERFITLQVTILPSALALNFRMHRPPGMQLHIFQQLESHFRLLWLADRYRKMSLEYLRSERRALGRFYGPQSDAARVAAELTQEAEDWENDFGPNHWRAILCRTLAADAAFCDGGFTVLNDIQ